MIDSGRTLTLAAHTLHENGAKAIYALISHGLLSEVNMSIIETLPIQQLVVSFSLMSIDSIPIRDLTTVEGD